MKKKLGVIFIIQILVLLGIGIFVQQKDRVSLDTPLDTWQSGQVSYNAEEKNWYMDSNSGSKENMLYGPYVELKKGSYTVTIDYETDTAGNVCTFDANPKTDSYAEASSLLKYSDVSLDNAQRTQQIEMETKEAVKDFEVKIDYCGSGYLKISNITIRENSNRDVRHLTCLVFVVLLLDGLYLFRKNVKEHKKELILLLGMACIGSLPIMMVNYYDGHDLQFHLLRIEGIVQELKLGHFPARMHSVGCSGYGYPVSIFYCDLLLYIAAILRLLGFSVLCTYKIYVFLINLATVCVAYWCLRRIFERRAIAMTGAMAYTFASYRLIDLYVRASVGEYTAMLAFPIVALAIYQIYTAKEEEWKSYRKNALLLAIGMTGLITSHVLSTEMVGLYLVVIALVLIKKTVRKNTLKVLGMAAVETVLLNAWFLVPFLDYYKNADVQISSQMSDTVARIQENGVYLGQLFAFFQSPRGLSVEQVCERPQFTPGIVLMGALLAAFYLLLTGKRNKKCLFYTAFSVAALFMATNLFPWNACAEHIPGFRFLASVQFPWRYLGIAMVFLTLLLGEVLVWMQKEYAIDLNRTCAGIMLIGIFMMCVMTSQLFDTGKNVSTVDGGDIRTYSGASVNKNFVGTEYMREGSERGYTDLTGNYNTENLDEMKELSRKGNTIQLHCEVSAQTEGTVEVPLFNYPGYHVRDKEGNEYDITDGTNNVIRFALPAGFNGDVTVTYEEPIGWRLAEWISLLTLVGMIAIGIIRRKKESHTS